MILDRLKRLAVNHEGIEVVWLYGSRATGQEQPDSDFDLAIAFCEVANNYSTHRRLDSIISIINK